MDYSHANLCCVLKVDTRCAACKGHTIEVLSSIEGVYDVTIDAERKTVQIMGQVNPNYCVKALSRCGVHAELIWANLSHPKMLLHNNNNNNYYYYYGGEPAASRSSLPPEGMWHHHHHHDQAYDINNNGYNMSSSSISVVPAPPDQYYDPYLQQYYDRNIDYYPYVDHNNNNKYSTNFCSIM
ncbi:hypothetical protein OROMI_032348 [Orobanche minor]